MIQNIIFDMGNVLIYFNRDVFLDRVGLTDPADRILLKREVYLSLEWSRMDRGSLTDEEASELIIQRVPERLHDTSYRQHDYWPKVPAYDLFDGTLISADVHLVKPQPEIYELMCSTFSLKKDECVFIDDSTPNVEGAFFVGMPAVVFHDDVQELRGKLRALGVRCRA